MLRIGDVVRTSYDTGPYKIVEIHGPCTCCDDLEEQKREPHYHLVCEWAGHRVKDHRYGHYYLNNYRADGTNTNNDDHLIVEGPAMNTTPDLFGIAQ